MWLWHGALQSFNWKVKLTSGIRWAHHFLDYFSLTFHDPAPPLMLPPPASQWSRCLRDSGCQARRQACRDRGCDQCLLNSQSPIVKVWLTQANIGSDRLQNTIITYLSTINPQHRTTKSSGRSVTSQWLLTILTGRGQHSWWGSCVKGRVLCSCLQRLVVT